MRVHSSPIITSRLHLRAWHRELTAILWLAVLLAGANFAHQVIVPAENQFTHGFAAYYTASRLLLSGQFDARVYDNAWFEAQARAAMNGDLHCVDDGWPGNLIAAHGAHCLDAG